MADTRMLVPVAHLAKLFSLTERRCQQLAADGIIPRAERGKYHLVESVIGYVKFLQTRAYGKSDTIQDSHYERTRYMKHKADITAMDVAERRGELINAEAVRRQDFKLGRILRNNLQSMPDRISALVAAEADEKTCHRLIADEVNRSLIGLLAALEAEPFDEVELDLTRKAAHDSLGVNLARSADAETDAGSDASSDGA